MKGPRSGPAATFALPLAACALWLVLLALAAAAADPRELGPGQPCVLRISLLGALPLAAGGHMLRRAAPLQLGGVGLCLSLAAFSLAALASRALFARDGALPLLIWHGLSVLLLAGAGAAVARAASRVRRARPGARARPR
jgi:hypothetical protein